MKFEIQFSTSINTNTNTTEQRFIDYTYFAEDVLQRTKINATAKALKYCLNLPD